VSNLNQLVPYFEPGAEITAQASVALLGMRCVVIDPAKTNFQSQADLSNTSDDSNVWVKKPAAGAHIFGVAGWDCAINKFVTIFRGPGMCVPIKAAAAAALAPGVEVETDANGEVVALTTGKAVGMNMRNFSAGANNFAAVLLY
jgi:hypothetical protein